MTYSHRFYCSYTSVSVVWAAEDLDQPMVHSQWHLNADETVTSLPLEMSLPGSDPWTDQHRPIPSPERAGFVQVCSTQVSSSGWCPHSLEVIVSPLHLFQSVLKNANTVWKTCWDSAGGLCGAKAAKPDVGPEGNPRTTPSLEGTSWFGGEGHPWES